MNIIIGADLVPTESNIDLFKNGELEALLGLDLERIVSQATYRIFNLEVPLADNSKPILKCGPNLIAPTSTVKAYTAMKVDLLTLANNHIMDQDVQGLESTIKTLRDNNISYLGAGNNLAEASKPHFFEFGSKRIGVYACCEHEFGVATEKTPGANLFNPLESLDHIVSLKKECDYVIVLYHGGKEHYRYPSPMLQKVCRKLVDKGADLVVCQHSHCVGCEEKYNGGTIVYGQGNFLFDRSANECWNTSVLISINENMNISYIPLIKHENAVRIACGEEANKILNDFKNRNEEIKQNGFVERKYQEFADSMIEGYLFSISGMEKSFFLRAFNRLTGRRFVKWVLNRKYTKSRKLALQNFIECEAHRELLLEGLKGTKYE